eukprot:m.52939 g.52939  ORF g.52939 m.52939 type:complete len:67 (-) comp10829_c0_seq1:2922-3122(-)
MSYHNIQEEKKNIHKYNQEKHIKSNTTATLNKKGQGEFKRKAYKSFSTTTAKNTTLNHSRLPVISP